MVCSCTSFSIPCVDARATLQSCASARTGTWSATADARGPSIRISNPETSCASGRKATALSDHNRCIVCYSTTQDGDREESRKKVFADERLGIVCYQISKSGEVICEGFDEGPYFNPARASRTPHRPWEGKTWCTSRCHPKLVAKWDETLQMAVFEGFDEG
ncbi:hypothetical protein KP509_19G059400 [Ceratopteris richardii]|uniref:Uncharacterized protein n=1 Tax=Ceratopteris richardii TaxID=49495 RepID=A0A8T2SNZ6_CERRI|nr:hypothetical protein KP509_19G059400 [Ceratopteris richardii]